MDGIDGTSFSLGFVCGVAAALLAAYLVKRLPQWWTRMSVFVALALLIALVSLVVTARNQGCGALCQMLGVPAETQTPLPTSAPAPNRPTATPTARPQTIAATSTPQSDRCTVLSGAGLQCRALP